MAHAFSPRQDAAGYALPLLFRRGKWRRGTWLALCFLLTAVEQCAREFLPTGKSSLVGVLQRLPGNTFAIGAPAVDDLAGGIGACKCNGYFGDNAKARDQPD